MKSAILYAASEKLTPAHIRLTPHPDDRGHRNGEIWVRMEIVTGDCLGALDKARSMKEETVMNTYTLESD